MATRWPHRIRQFWRSLQPVVSETDLTWIGGRLTAAEFALYRGMSLRDQQHCLDVTRTLLGRHPDAAERLVKLTLLHDVGKQLVPFRLWERVVVVLWPRGQALPAADPLRHDRWRPWQMKYRHPEYGARLAEAAGCAQDLVSDIRAHHAMPPPNERISLFQWADDVN